MRKRLTRTAAAVTGLAALALLTVTTPAEAAGRDGKCDGGEFCVYYLGGQTGSVSDFTGSISNYGSTQPTCYEFKGTGYGKGQCIKNNTWSVWNRSSKSVRVYFNSGYAGAYQTFAPGAKGNLNSTLRDNNASHKFLS